MAGSLEKTDTLRRQLASVVRYSVDEAELLRRKREAEFREMARKESEEIASWAEAELRRRYV